MTPIEYAQVVSEAWSAEEVLAWAYQKFGDEVAISSAFGAEGMVLIDIASKVGENIRVFTLDTEFLHPETYTLMERVEERYGIRVERVLPLFSPEEQERAYGAALWLRDPDRCCELRKVEPLKQKLAGLQAWITSIRRDQTSARAQVRKISWDAKFGLMKINPLADWPAKRIWQYIYQHNVPYNPLHDQGFPSIGCTHCTRAIRPGEDARAGRWSGFAKTECGLHAILPAKA